MKTIAVIAVVVLAISAVHSAEIRNKRDVTTKAPKCKEGDSYEEDCNTCTCTQHGYYICTLRDCYHGPIFPDTPAATEAPKCVAGHSYEEDCNTCTCSETGIYVCTRRACFHGPQHADTNRKRRDVTTEAPKCTPGHSYEEDCNTCRCTETGIYACTRRACFHGPQHADTNRKRRDVTTEAPKCVEGHSYMDDCKRCVCLGTGHYACTERACGSSHRNEKQSDVTTETPKCTPGHSYEEDCNTCRCTETGIYARTRRACYHGPQFPDTQRKRRDVDAVTDDLHSHHHYRAANEHFHQYNKPVPLNVLSFEVERCAPGEIKNMDCNRCKCTTNGKGFLCSRHISCRTVTEKKTEQAEN